jgi:hypothetical protein
MGQDTTEWWNHVCAWVVEEYGLPGGKYNTELTENYMVFNFNKQEDAAMTALRWGNN